MTSYVVTVLLTSVPVDPATEIIKRKLKQDGKFQHRTSVPVEHIISLLEFCPKNRYFLFQCKILEQIEGAAIGSTISPIMANLYTEDFKIKVIHSAQYLPGVCKRYVDDTFVEQITSDRDRFLEHINSIDQCIPFTVKDKKNRWLPEPDRCHSTAVYKNIPHTDQYLQWDSHHNLAAKFSVINTLTHRTKTPHSCLKRKRIILDKDHKNASIQH